MNKSNQKARLSLVSSQKKANVRKVKEEQSAANLVSPNEAVLGQLATVEFWKNEIAGLRAEKFDSMQQAIDKVIEQVLDRMQLNDSDDEADKDPQDLKEFLRLVFESSETLQMALRKTLKIS